PNTVYAELQHGVIVRFDKRTGERIGIQPQEEKGGTPLRWNWDAPFIISPDLTRQLDRNILPVMGRIWGPEAVAKNTSTALYGNVSAIAESPKKEGLIYVGTDDGLVQVTENAGANWRKPDR